MQTIQKAMLKMTVKAHTATMQLQNKLRERRGGMDAFVASMVLMIIVVVVGGSLLLLFGDTMKEVWQTIKGRVNELFNYS